jgi:photosystem II stability/assembly factor-like uncharacterized protein
VKSFLFSVQAVAALGTLLVPLRAQKWDLKYFYDKDKSSLTFVDIQFPTDKRGVAVGEISDGKRDDPVSFVTADGGETWERIPLKETPLSLFFLNETAGWMVTNKGLWRTSEAGKSWTKLPKVPADILRVYFQDENNGWAVGARKSILETHDGARTWKPLAAAAEPPGNRDYSAYTWIAFANPRFGLITGWNIPPRRWGNEFPDWMDPASVLYRADLPHLSYAVKTSDGGKTWVSNSASLFGEVERVRFTADGKGLGLAVYSQSFRYPSEVYRIDWHTGKSVTIYKDPKFAVRDIWLAPDGTAYLAGTFSQAKLRDIVPGKVRVLMSKDYTGWTEIPVDYRAEAHRLSLAAVDTQHMWMATDGGMILKLVAGPAN